MRLAQNAHAHFLFQRGELQAAFKSYMRSRDYCATGGQVVEQCLALISVSDQMPQLGPTHMANYAQKAEVALETSTGTDPLILAQLKVASALPLLDAKKYRLASKRLTDTPPDLGDAFADVASSQDVALYGALTSLATLDRKELRAACIDNVAFRSYLELLPDARQLVEDFYASRYASALATLAKLRDGLCALDPHLRPHREALCDAVRQRAVCAYVAPFSRVRLETMAAALATEPGALQAELESLIGEGQVSARIDAGAGVLHARTADARNQAFERTLAMADGYLRDTKALLLRASLMQHDVMQAGGRKGGGGGGGEDGPGGGQGHRGGNEGRRSHGPRGHGAHWGGEREYGGHRERQWDRTQSGPRSESFREH